MLCYLYSISPNLIYAATISFSFSLAFSVTSSIPPSIILTGTRYFNISEMKTIYGIIYTWLCICPFVSFALERNQQPIIQDRTNILQVSAYSEKIPAYSKLVLQEFNIDNSTILSIQQKTEKKQTSFCGPNRASMKICGSIVTYPIGQQQNTYQSADEAVADAMDTYVASGFQSACLDSLRCFACAQAFPQCSDSVEYQPPCRDMCLYYYAACGYYVFGDSACNSFPDTDCTSLSFCPGGVEWMQENTAISSTYSYLLIILGTVVCFIVQSVLANH